MQNLSLYYLPTCPYCRKVLDFMDENHITVPLKNVQDEVNKEVLVEIGGKSQVPCLVIDDDAKYESDEIIAWMEENLV